MYPLITKSAFCPIFLQWPHFFSDMLQCLQSGSPWTVDLYLRVLMAIDCEVVDRQVIHSMEVCGWGGGTLLVCVALLHEHICPCVCVGGGGVGGGTLLVCVALLHEHICLCVCVGGGGGTLLVCVALL